MSFDNFMSFEKFMMPKSKKPRKRSKITEISNDFGGIDPDKFEDVGAGFNGRFKNIGGGFLEDVPINNKGGEAVSSFFTSGGEQPQGFGNFGGFEKSFKVTKGKKKKKGKGKKSKKKNGNGENGNGNGNGNGKRETVGGFLARKINERRKARAERLPETKGETGGPQSQSRFTKEDIEKGKADEIRTQEKLQRLIEEEKKRRDERNNG